MNSSGRDPRLGFFSVVGALATVFLGLSFWRLGDRTAAMAARWGFVWLWTIGCPAFYASQLRRRLGQLDDQSTRTSLDSLYGLAWQILMAGCLAAFGMVSLLRAYLVR